MDVCPYELLELDKRTFTREQLRANYKRIARETHPDKRGGSATLFKLVNLAYEKLSEELERRRVDRPFDQLKKQALEHKGRDRTLPRKDVDKFDVSKFNKMFEKHKFHDDSNGVDDGYGDAMAPSTAVREDIQIPRTMTEYNPNKFQREFERAARGSVSEKRVIARSGPVPFETTGMAFAELGITKVDDYSGANASGKALHYTDYMTAHTTSALIDPERIAPRHKYRDVKELQRERAAMSLAATPEDARAAAREQKVASRREARRQREVQRRDAAIGEYHERMSRLRLDEG